MRIISYNVNGIRAAVNKGLYEWLAAESPDILCLQETKAQPEQIDVLYFEMLGYRTIIHSAEKKGYSGLAILTKTQPDKIIYGMGHEEYDKEGRVLRADYGNVTLVNVYIPSGTTGDIRQSFKMKFLADFEIFINKLAKERPNLIITGDFNICHKAIDINHPERHKNSSGFLPEERAWMDSFINNHKTDTFRTINQEPEQYSWWSYRANSRVKNLGWRIDYFFVTETLNSKIANAAILSTVNHSDHCPVLLELDN